MKIKIKSFNGELPSYLTVGKVYEVVSIVGKCCEITDDCNDSIIVNPHCSLFLEGGSWEVVNE